MIDNFDIISNIIKPLEKSDHVFIIHIITKKSVHRFFYIKNHEELNNLKSTIEVLCKVYDARAFIDLNSRDMKDIMTKTLKDLAECVYIMHFQPIDETINHSVNNTVSRDKFRLVFTGDAHDLEDVKDRIGRDNIIAEIPTPAGYQIIATQFKTNKLLSKYPWALHTESTGALLYHF